MRRYQSIKVLLKKQIYIFNKLKQLYPDIQKNNDIKISNNMVGVLLLYAYPNRLAKLREKGKGIYKLSNGKGALLDIQSELFNEEYLVIPRLNTNENGSFISSAVKVNKEDIEKYFSHILSRDRQIKYDPKVKSFSVKENRSFINLQIDSKTIAGDEIDFKELVFGFIKEEGLGVLNWDKKALSLKQRVDLLNHHMSIEDFPDLSDKYLLNNMDIWLDPYLNGIKSIKELESLDLHEILSAQISWEMKKELDELVPEYIKVPSGSNIKIDYENIDTPVLAVKIQEIFGMKEFPLILRGKVALQIHLLSPANRPVQITYDLKSFWENSYSEVVKELKGKYKKHYWPDDPLQAQATNKTKKFMDKNGN